MVPFFSSAIVTLRLRFKGDRLERPSWSDGRVLIPTAERSLSLHRKSSVGIGIASTIGLGFGCLLLVGCGDDTRKDGTQVKVSEETKAQVNDMRDMYKDMGKGKKKN
jgi:hypothetical protein